MDVVLPQIDRAELSLADTLEERRRAVRMQRLRSLALSNPDVMVSVILKWLQQDAESWRAAQFRSCQQRRPNTEWYSHIPVRSRS